MFNKNNQTKDWLVLAGQTVKQIWSSLLFRNALTYEVTDVVLNIYIAQKKLAMRAAILLFALFLMIPAKAQTNQELYEERIISLSVYEFLTKRGANTPEQRAIAIKEACATGELGGEDCFKYTDRR